MNQNKLKLYLPEKCDLPRVEIKNWYDPDKFGLQ